MPTPLTDGSIVILVLEYEQNGQRLLNTLHYQYEKAGGAPDYTVPMGELIDQLQVAGRLQDDVISSMHNTCTLVDMYAQPVYPTRLTRVARRINLTGIKGGAAAPQNVSAVITKQADIAARYGRGTWHLVGLAAADNVAGFIGAGLAAIADEIGDDITTDLTLNTAGLMHPVLWNRKVPARVTRLTNWFVEDTVRVMRRRTVRVGK